MTARRAGFIHRHPVVVCFALAYLFSWAVWGTNLAHQHGLIGFHLPGVLAFFGVTLAAFTSAASAGPAGVHDLLSRMLRWRVNIRWYAAAVAVPFALTLLLAGVYRLSGGSVSVGTRIPLGTAVAYIIISTPFEVITEEAAWRGFALPRLQARHTALTASLIMGVVWGIWHTPLFFMPNTAQSHWPYPNYLLFISATSVLSTWIYNNSGGSVLIAGLFHAATNAAYAFSGPLNGGTQYLQLTAGLAVAAAILVVLIAGPRRLVRGCGEAGLAFVMEGAASEPSSASTSG